MADRKTGLASRRVALEVLRAVEDRGAYSNLAVASTVDELAEPRDRAFASHLAYEALRWRGTLDWALEQVLSRPLADVEPELRHVLRLGAVQLLRSDVPSRAAVDTAVDLAREVVPAGRSRGAAGFVNGVLRALDRTLRAGGLPWPDPESDPVAHLALATAHPAWIVGELLGRLPADEVRALLEADNDPPGLTLRAVTDRDTVLAELRLAGLDAEPGESAPEAVLAPGADPGRLPAVAEGRAVPQDQASMQVVRACRVEPGDRVLDLCAGPGGKTTHLATLAGPTGHVTAVELHPHRARLIEETASRLGLDVDIVVGDATDAPVDGEFDVVLVDAPCTGLGTGRRRPEVRWRRTPDDVAELAVLQAALLDAAADRVGPGGHLTYAACTWTAGETSDVADRFVERHADAFDEVDREQLLPHRHGTDGMFHATFRRR